MSSHFRSAKLIIFMTIFIDLLGFGIIIPIFPFFLQDTLQKPELIGRTLALLMTMFSLMQFIFSPIWGRLSDRIGRRPVLMISLSGSVISHIALALSTSVTMIFLSRIFMGIFAATVPTAMAYISDITSPEERTKGMGMVGAAFGLGFIIGPAIGGVLSPYGYRVPLFFAAALSALALAVAVFKLKETVNIKSGQSLAGDYRRFNLKNLYLALRHPQLGLLFLIFLMVTLSFANLETIFAMYTERLFKFDARQTGYIFAFIGVISATVQGLLIGRLSARFGEVRLVTFSTLLLGTAFLLLPMQSTLSGFLIVLGLISASIGTHNPSVLSLVSKNAHRDQQGGILGINQSFSSLGRIIGPLWAGYFFDTFGPGQPFYSAGLLILLASFMSLGLYRRVLVQS